MSSLIFFWKIPRERIKKFKRSLGKRTHSYTRSSEMLIYSFTALGFFIPIYCWWLKKYSSQFVEYQENKQPRKISERKIYTYTGMSEKWGLSHTNQENSGQLQVYTFRWKKGANHIPGSAEKGAIRHAHQYYAIYRKLPSPTPRPIFFLSEGCFFLHFYTWHIIRAVYFRTFLITFFWYWVTRTFVSNDPGASLSDVVNIHHMALNSHMYGLLNWFKLWAQIETSLFKELLSRMNIVTVKP